MATAIIGTGNIGGTLARHLVRGGEAVVLAAKDEAKAEALAQELGELARVASVGEAIAEADVVVLAVGLDTSKELISKDSDTMEGPWVCDPAKPIAASGTSARLHRARPNGMSIRFLPMAAAGYGWILMTCPMAAVLPRLEI